MIIENFRGQSHEMSNDKRSSNSVAPRVVITGATGLLGRSLVRAFEASEWSVQGWGLSRADGVNVVAVDLTTSSVNSFLDAFCPDVLVHAAAHRRPDVIENDPAAAAALNEEATRRLATECFARQIKMIFVSTDYVFDGTKPPYSETCSPNPLNAYGLSKLAGETATLAASTSHVVLRVPILYGPVETLQESAVTVLFEAVKDSRPRQLDSVQRRYPTHVDAVAAACLLLCRRVIQIRRGSIDDAASASGIFHFSSDESFTKYEMALVMADAFGLPKDGLLAVATATTTRPVDARLSCARLQALGGVFRSDFSHEIRNVLQPFL